MLLHNIDLESAEFAVQLAFLEVVCVSYAYVNAEHFPATLAILHVNMLLLAASRNCCSVCIIYVLSPNRKWPCKRFLHQNKMLLHS